MAAKGYKSKKRGKRRFTSLDESLQATEAWATMKPGPRALYFELKRRFNGSNNGNIRMSHREAAELLNIHRNTVGPYFTELEERGFIRQTSRGRLGYEGNGIASTWALTELPEESGRRATMTFRTWRTKTKARHKEGARLSQRSCTGSDEDDEAA